MTALERAAEGLLAAAVELERLAQGDDPDALGRALRERERAFQSLQAAWDGEPPIRVRGLLERIAQLDERALARALESRESILRQLRDLRGASDAVRTLEPGAEPPRFVSRRA